MQAFLRATGSPAEYGYTIGDEVEFMNGDIGSPPTISYKGIYADDTTIYWHTGPALVITDRNTGNPVNPTLGLWQLVLRAYA
jgi:hypothetical protein